MFMKMYFLMWAVGMLAAAVFFVTGNLNPMMALVFGFLTLGAVVMGLLMVLPYWSEHHGTPKL